MSTDVSAIARTSVWRRKSFRTAVTKVIAYALAAIGAVVVMFPIVWSLSTAFKELADILAYPPKIFPDPFIWDNVVYAFTKTSLGISMINTTIIGVLSIVGQVLSGSITAYGFARLRFPGRDAIFVGVLATMMIPFAVVMVPQFVLFRYLGWIDTWRPLIVPTFLGGSAFYIFLLRQFFLTIPHELDDSARIDGCSTFGIYWRIIMPMAVPALATVAIYTFRAQWLNLLGPLIYINTEEKWTVSLLLSSLTSAYITGVAFNVIMACSLISIIPLVLIFFTFQRMFIQGIVITGVKG